MSWYFVTFLFVAIIALCISAYIKGYYAGARDMYKKTEEEHDRATAEYLEKMENECD